MKILLIPARNYEKIDGELFPWSSTLHEILSFSQIFCYLLELPYPQVCDALPLTRSKKMLAQHAKQF